MSSTENPISYIVAVICPPVSILAKPGVDSSTIGTNIMLTLLGWIPGVLHAWNVLATPSYKTVYTSTKPPHQASTSSAARRRSSRGSAHYAVDEPRGYLEHGSRGYRGHERRGYLEHESRGHRGRESRRYLAYDPRRYEGSHKNGERSSRRGSTAGLYVPAEKADNPPYLVQVR